LPDFQFQHKTNAANSHLILDCYLHLRANVRIKIQQLDTANKIVEDPKSLIRVFRLPDMPHPKWMPMAIAAGFNNLIQALRAG
jgi:hypothetical protein